MTLETGDGIVFRVGRTVGAAEGHDLEWRVLPELRLPVAVPRPEWRIEPGHPDFPFGVIGHRKLPGRPLATGDSLAAEVGRMLRALHGAAPANGLSKAMPWQERLLQVQDLLPALEQHFGAELKVWWQAAHADGAMASHPHVFIHRDLWYENILVDGVPPRVSAVLDWGGACLGDPAEDLAPQFYLGRAFADTVLDVYGADSALRHRTQRHRTLREFAGIRWAIEQDDAEELQESMDKLRRVLPR